MALKSRRRNKKTTQKNVLSVKMQSQQTRRERLRWLRSVVALAVALVALVLDANAAWERVEAARGQIVAMLAKVRPIIGLLE